MYNTGDVGRFLSDGRIEFLGRKDDQIKLRGYRVELGEITSVLEEYGGLCKALVIVNEDESGRKHLVAYFESEKSERIKTEQLRLYLEHKLPDYMIPNLFIEVADWPLTAHGKIDRKALPDSTTLIPESCSDVTLPSSDMEKRLVKIWEHVLNCKGIGVSDNFFELGGDSILCLQIVSRAHRDGLEISPKQIYTAPTIRSLAPTIKSVERPVNQEEPVMADIPITPIQYWFFEQNQPNPNHWNQSMLLKTEAPMDKDLLRQAFQIVIAHHDVSVFVLKAALWSGVRPIREKPYLQTSCFRPIGL